MLESSHGRLLIVDDEVELMSVLCETLSEQGYDTIGHTSSRDVLAALRARDFDVLLTDLMMPHMDGTQLLRAALEIDPNLVGIIMTGQGTIQTAVEAMKLGAFDYVLKPFKLSTLLPVLARAMEVRRLRLQNLHLRETMAFYELSRSVAFSLDPRTTLNRLADAAQEQCQADEISVMLPTPDGLELQVAIARGGQRWHLLGRRVSLDQGIAGWVARFREPLVLHGQIADPRFAPLFPRPEIKSAISMPMMAGGKLVGVLNLNSVSSCRPFTLGQVKALTVLVGTASTALESARLYAQAKDAEERYRNIFENTAEGIFQSSPDGRFLVANPALARLLGYESPQELMSLLTDIGRQLYVEPERRVEFARLLEEHGRVSGLESRAYRRDGEIIWISENCRAVRDQTGVLVHYEGTVEDITERKRAEERLRESETRYRTLVEAIDDAINVKDLEGRYVTVNAEFARRVGRPREEILGKTARELYGPEVGGGVEENDRLALATGVAVHVDQQHPERELARFCHVHKLPLVNDTGETIGLVTVSRDMTERKEMEQRLLRAQRLETAGRIAGQVAHDFGNLLMPMMAYPELIKMQVPPDHPAVQFCDPMLRAAQQMAAINENLLTLGRRGRVQCEPTDVNLVVRQALEMTPRAPASLSLESALADDLFPVAGVPSQLARVVANLIFNARDAMGDSGRLTISTEAVYLDRPIGRYNRVEIGEYVRLAVSDTGCGIPDEIKDRIFDAFFTTKKSDERRGSGLGLAIVQAIVDDHHGYVDVDSEVGRGTTFTVYLPLLRSATKESCSPDRLGGSERILAVDDDRYQREVLQAMLQTLGYQVDTMPSGESALEHLREHPADLLILDMVMPNGIDGVETYRRVAEIRPGQRAILLSGFAATERVKDAQALGAGAFIRKPVSLDALATAMRKELHGE